MDFELFIPNRYENTKEEAYPYKFSDILNITTSFQCKIEGIEFDEKELIKNLVCENNIVKIGCSYGEQFSEHWIEVPKIKSNRGRKPNPKPPKKPRKRIGSLPYFHSQITFTILKNDLKDLSLLRQSSTNKEIFKVKVFKNGTINIPGVKEENYSDAMKPLHEIVDYLSKNLKIELKIDESVFKSHMNNYRFNYISGGNESSSSSKKKSNNKNPPSNVSIFSLREMNNYFNSKIEGLININFVDLQTGICDGLNYDQLFKFLKISKNDKLIKIKAENLKKIHSYFKNRDTDILLSEFNKKYHLDVSNIAKRIRKHMYLKDFEKLYKVLLFSEDNLVFASNYSIDDNKAEKSTNAGLFVNIRTPVYTTNESGEIHIVDDTADAVMKIYLSGKVNIVKATCKKECEFIAKWFNKLLHENKKFTFSSSSKSNYN